MVCKKRKYKLDKLWKSCYYFLSLSVLIQIVHLGMLIHLCTVITNIKGNTDIGKLTPSAFWYLYSLFCAKV